MLQPGKHFFAAIFQFFRFRRDASHLRFQVAHCDIQRIQTILQIRFPADQVIFGILFQSRPLADNPVKMLFARAVLRRIQHRTKCLHHRFKSRQGFVQIGFRRIESLVKKRLPNRIAVSVILRRFAEFNQNFPISQKSRRRKMNFGILGKAHVSADFKSDINAGIRFMHSENAPLGKTANFYITSIGQRTDFAKCGHIAQPFIIRAQRMKKIPKAKNDAAEHKDEKKHSLVAAPRNFAIHTSLRLKTRRSRLLQKRPSPYPV